MKFEFAYIVTFGPPELPPANCLAERVTVNATDVENGELVATAMISCRLNMGEIVREVKPVGR